MKHCNLSYKKSVALGLLVCLIPGVSFAHDNVAQEIHFQQMFFVAAPDIIVPTVVEVPLPNMSGQRTQFLVVDSTTQTYQAASFVQEFETEPVKIGINVNGTPRSRLIDADQKTSETFPLPEVGTGLVEFFITGEEAFAASSLVIDLAQNVSLPVSIEITTQVEGEEVIVLAKNKPNSTQVRFPQVTAAEWFVAMEYMQPLRISELRFVQDNIQTDTSNSLRFLAQPETDYQVYFDPELYVSLETAEAGNLATDLDVLVLDEVPVMEANPAFAFADSDADTIADQIDNCVSIVNTDQTDINNNGRGDVCV